MDTPVFTLHGKHTEEEYVQFYRFIALRSKRVKWTYGVVLAVCLIWLISGICGVLFLGMSIIHIIMPLALGAYYVWLLTGGLNRRAAKAYRSSKLAAGAEYDMSFFEDHFDEVDAYGESSIPYDKLHGIFETPTCFYPMLSSSQGYVLRKDVLPEGAAEFLRGIKGKYSL